MMSKEIPPADDPVLEDVASVYAWVYNKEGQKENRRQWVIREQPVTLYLNGDELLTLLCAGHHLDELAVGFFLR